tara:strand:- start:463 stop:777 length:315 start_codon:yes stop_codon:yes gene_type:complete
MAGDKPEEVSLAELETEVQRLIEENKRLRSDLEIRYQAKRKLEFETLEQQVLIHKLRGGIRNILSDYDITDLIREVDEEDWNFEQQALIRIKGLIEETYPPKDD